MHYNLNSSRQPRAGASARQLELPKLEISDADIPRSLIEAHGASTRTLIPESSGQNLLP